VANLNSKLNWKSFFSESLNLTKEEQMKNHVRNFLEKIRAD
jgi:hypothetical protein